MHEFVDDFVALVCRLGSAKVVANFWHDIDRVGYFVQRRCPIEEIIKDKGEEDND